MDFGLRQVAPPVRERRMWFRYFLSVFVFSCLLSWFLMAFTAISSSYTPAIVHLIDCGATQGSTVDGLQWEADSDSQHLSTKQQILANTSRQSNELSNVSVSSLLLTARIFRDSSKYSFPVTPGRYWLRLYFFPFRYESFDLTSAIFSVTTDDYVLLHNISVSAAMASSNNQYLFKEYSINVTSDTLSIYFTPATNSYAFINALQVVSMPSDIISDDSSPLGSNNPEAIGIPDHALQTMYRVNVGGPMLDPVNDSLWRTWQSNESYLVSAHGVETTSTTSTQIKYLSSIPEYLAPPYVYSTAIQMNTANTAQSNFNISWNFPIDAGFLYMIRLHFCEIVYTTEGQRIFNVYLQKQIAFSGLDIVQKATYPDSPYYRDFTVNASGAGNTALQIDIGPSPNVGVGNNNAILNGIEIWKLNNSLGSLDGLTSVQPHFHSKSKIGPVVGGVAGGLAALGLLLVGFYVFFHQKSKAVKHSSTAWLPLPMHGGNSASIGSKMSAGSHKSGTGSYVSSAPSSLGRFFTFAEIQEATNNFDEALVLGVGGFGKVYKGELEDGMKVAVKRGNPRSEQGLTEFQTEIQMLSKLRHRHLVSLIGYCEEHCEMILVYEYMANGPLRSHLYGADLPSLSWKQRLEICIGAARGLHYLHTGAAQGIIHRDVKTTNILLDENFVSKVSDFGLSKTGPTLDRTHVSTAVKGSFGYLDPEYFRRQQLTEKSDVYSFGVVLFEVLCARPAINPALPRDQVNIAEWAMHWQQMGMLDQIIDQHLAGTINMESLKKFGETAEKCLAEQGIDRPTMGDVLWNLEYALQLQETAMSNDLDEDSTNRIMELPLRIPAQEHWDVSAVENQSLASEDDFSEDATASVVFSQLVKPHGRI
eukprot:c26906_g1_i1 orf=389-3010(-)